MPIVLEPRRLIKPPDAGIVRANRNHFAYRNLEFAYVGGSNRYPRNLAPRGEEVMTQVTGTTIALSADGYGVLSDAADRAFYAPSRNPTALGYGGTLLWRGVLLGAPGSSGSGTLFACIVDSGASSPYVVFSLDRDTGNSDVLAVFLNSGGSYVYSYNNIGLSAYHGRPITIAVSNEGNTSILSAWANYGSGPQRITLAGLNGASGNPSTTTNARWKIGTNYGAGRFSNSVTTAALAWSRAFNDNELKALVENHLAPFEVPSRIVPFGLAAGGVSAATATAAAGTSTVSATGSATATATATAAAGTSTVSAIGSVAPGAGTANAIVAAGTSTVSATGASNVAASAIVAFGAASTSAIGGSRAATTVTPAAGTSTVLAAGSTATLIAAGSPIPAAGTSTVSAISSATAIISTNLIPAAGTSTVSAISSATGIIRTNLIPAAGVATVLGSTGVSIRLSKSALKLRFASYVTPTAQDFSNLIDSYTNYSETLANWPGTGSGTGVLRVLSNISVTVMPFASLAVSLAGASNTAQATDILGASSLGQIIFTASTTSQTLAGLGGGAVGQQVFAASSTSQFTSLLGPTVTAATQAEVSGRTVNDKYVPPGNMRPHPGLAKAWCWMSVTAGVATLRGAHNITDVSVVATGRYRFFMGSPMATSAYAVITAHSGELTEDSTNIGFGYVANPRFKKPDRFDVFFGRPLGGTNTNPGVTDNNEIYVSAYGWT